VTEVPDDKRAELDEALSIDGPEIELPPTEPKPSKQEPEPEPFEAAAAAESPPPREGERLKPKRRGKSWLRSETTRRVLWALPWVVFAIAIVAVGDIVFTAALVVLGILGLREFFAMTEAARPFPIPAYLTVTGMVLAAHFGSSFQVLLFAAAGFPLVFVFAARRPSHEAITYSIAITALGIAWMGIPFAHAVLLRDLPRHGGALVIDVLVATIACDTAAYGAGRMFGSRRVTPRLSPNKTLEGFIGGFVGAVLGFWLAGLYQDWLSGSQALIMGLAVALLAPIGDLFASMIKRDCDVKDTGRLFGPHGGLIDRLDAILFTIVAGYYLAVAFLY
jgi:phosphatidate cytidylyltransferase